MNVGIDLTAPEGDSSATMTLPRRELPWPKAPTDELTVGMLMDYLANIKSAWTEEDEQYLGSFRSQKLNVMHHDPINHVPMGVGPAVIEYHGGLDFILHPKTS